MAAVDPQKERLTIIDLALTALALGSGVTDVATFLTLGAVFTSAMTGNTALLGIAISHGDILAGAHSVSALLGFTFGAALATAIVAMGTDTARSLSAIRALLLIEIFCLGVFALILTVVRAPGESLPLYALILLSAIGMGIQGIAARQMSPSGINTIVFTTTLISIVFSLISALVRRPGGERVPYATRRQIGSFLAYGLGAIAAGVLAGPGLAVIAWVPAMAVIVALGCCEAAIKTGTDRP
jgi:uncharacterized membrane protein YoaK (UPF0700 family)